jgi:hypothetical protein
MNGVKIVLQERVREIFFIFCNSDETKILGSQIILFYYYSFMKFTSLLSYAILCEAACVIILFCHEVTFTKDQE